MIESGNLIGTVFEVLVFSLVIYAFIRFLQETRGSAVLKGFIFLVLLLGVGFITVVKQFDLVHLEYIGNQGLFIILIGLVVVFQPELRQVLVKLGEARVFQRLTREGRVFNSVADEIVQAAGSLQARGLGAIILIERSAGIGSYTEEAIAIDARLSSQVLESLFFRDTPTHDGAVVIRQKRIVAAGCVLPLSTKTNLPPSFGTRHRAAMGATEENDAVAVVASEETRRISVAEHGEIREIRDLAELRECLTGGGIAAEEIKGGGP